MGKYGLLRIAWNKEFRDAADKMPPHWLLRRGTTCNIIGLCCCNARCGCLLLHILRMHWMPILHLLHDVTSHYMRRLFSIISRVWCIFIYVDAISRVAKEDMALPAYFLIDDYAESIAYLMLSHYSITMKRFLLLSPPWAASLRVSTSPYRFSPRWRFAFRPMSAMLSSPQSAAHDYAPDHYAHVNVTRFIFGLLAARAYFRHGRDAGWYYAFKFHILKSFILSSLIYRVFPLASLQALYRDYDAFINAALRSE